MVNLILDYLNLKNINIYSENYDEQDVIDYLKVALE